MPIIRALRLNIESKLAANRANKSKAIAEEARKKFITYKHEPWFVQTDKDLTKLEAEDRIEREINEAFGGI